MTFTWAIASAFSKYVTLSGRAARSEFWYWTLFLAVVTLCLSILDPVIFPMKRWGPLASVFGLATFLPSVAVTVRRLHDTEKSGFWVLLLFLPPLSFFLVWFVALPLSVKILPLLIILTAFLWLVFLKWAIKRGTTGGNRFGEDPLAAGTPSVLQASDPLR